MTRKGKIANSSYGLGSLWKDEGEVPKLAPLSLASHLAVQAWKSFLLSPITSVLTMVTITTALLVFSMFILVLENVKGLVSSAQSGLTVSLYMKESAGDDDVRKLLGQIEKHSSIERAVLRDKDEALASFREALGERAVILDGLDQDNPLPASIEVQFKDSPEVADRIDEFAAQARDFAQVEQIDYSRGLVARLSGFLKFFRWGGFFSIIFMLLITSFIITNTIRLALYSHREEIEIMKLVGATNAFVRAPYMIEGFVQGLVGALLSLLLSYSCYVLVQDLVAKNDILQLLVSNISFLSWHSIVLVLICGVSVGILGSYLAVRKFLSV
ncbi:MAG: ABC transporter permease [Deltaproteobacteria bacterium]|nr:ABC transporter permease [Deltaproteobacteria bacterium]